MDLIEIENSRQARAFIELPARLYKSDPNWICPLETDVEAVFDPSRNVFFSHGKCTRWLLQDSKGQIVGRIAAFINYEKSDKNPQWGGSLRLSITKNPIKTRNLPAEWGSLNALITARRLTCYLIPPKPGCRKEACRQWMARLILARMINSGDC